MQSTFTYNGVTFSPRRMYVCIGGQMRYVYIFGGIQ
jgi:hypothetical protein